MPQNILFVELLGGIGDLVIALPAIHAVASAHPHAYLTVLTFSPGAELLDADPAVHRVIRALSGKARQAVEQTLATEQFDLIISDTNYDGIADLIQAAAPQRAITNLWRSPPDHEYVGERFVNILRQEGVASSTATQPDIYLTAAERAAARQQLGAAYRPLVVLCPDASMEIKRWSVEKFVALGLALHRQYGATLLLPAGKTDAGQTAAQIAGAIGSAAQIWPQGRLRQLAAAIANADLVVAVDTGLAHIAAALQVPTITLFGPSWAGRYGHSAPHINLQGFSQCPERNISNFTQQSCWYSGDCPFEWRSCLEEISVEAVLAAAESLASRLVVPLKAQFTAPSQAASQILSQFASQSPSKKNTPQPSEELSKPLPKQLSEQWQSVRHLLVIRLDNIGDVIMTSPVLQALKANLPQAKLTLMASPAGGLAVPLLPWVDDLLIWRTLWQDLGKLAFEPEREWRLIETLQAGQFDAAIILTSFSQSPHPAGLACALAGIPLRLGESSETDLQSLTDAVPASPAHIHQVERNLRLIESVGFTVMHRQLTLKIPEPITADAYLLLNPWTSCQSRNYSSQRWAEAARQLSQITGWPVVVTGVEKDRARAEPLLAILGERAVDRLGQTNLSQLAVLIAQARLVLTNNTSVMHIADAAQTPMVVAFAGTEQESQWCPRQAPARLLRRSTVCSPCYTLNCPHQLQCLDIPVEQVVESALELLQKCQRI